MQIYHFKQHDNCANMQLLVLLYKFLPTNFYQKRREIAWQITLIL